MEKIQRLGSCHRARFGPLTPSRGICAAHTQAVIRSYGAGQMPRIDAYESGAVQATHVAREKCQPRKRAVTLEPNSISYDVTKQAFKTP